MRKTAKLLIIFSLALFLVFSYKVLGASFGQTFGGEEIIEEEILLGGGPICVPRQGCVGQDSSDWTGVIRVDSGVWSTTTGGSNWSFDTNFGVSNLTSSSTIPVWLKDAVYASSTLRVTGITTLQSDLLLQDDKKIYFDTGQTLYIEYSDDHGGLLWGDPFFPAVAGLTILANTGADGLGMWEPYINIGADGRVTIENTTQGANKELLIKITDGVKIEGSELKIITTGSVGGVLKADNVAVSDSTLQFPNKSGTIALAGDFANKSLSNLNPATMAINTSLISDTDSTDDLGTSAKKWRGLYVDESTTTNATITDLYISGDIIGDLTGKASNLNITSQATGSLAYYSGEVSDAWANLSIGTDDYVLTASSTVSEGMAWMEAAAGNGAGASTALDNLADVAINTSLISDTDSTDDLGSSAKFWKDLYVDKIFIGGISEWLTVDAGGDIHFRVANEYFKIEDVTYATTLNLKGASGGVWRFLISGSASRFAFFQDVTPSSDSSIDLGTSSYFWDETYTDELVLQQGTMGATAADQVRLAGLDLSAGDSGLHIKTENDTEHLFASRVGLATTTPEAMLEVAGGILPAKLVADPCGAGYPSGTIFYNVTSGYPCYCDNSGDDLKFSDNSACF